MYEPTHSAEQLRYLQSLSLDRKIMITQTRIIEWYEKFDGQVYVSYSGGKDSTVLLELARMAYPEIPAAFVNTGLEYPEIRKFAMNHKGVEELRPRWGKAGKQYSHKPEDIITFMDVVTNWGYPIISKAVSNAIVESRRTPNGSRWERLHGNYKRLDGKRSQYDYSKYLPLYYLPFRISDECCKVSKKGPAHIYQHETGRHPIIATMAEESLIRKQAWLTTGCNAFNAKEPISKPMSFWTEQDVLHYIVRYGTEICSVYGEVIYEDDCGMPYSAATGICTPETHLKCSGCQRTGCVFCAFGAHLEKGETRYQRLKRTHPQLYDFCMRGGAMAEKRKVRPRKDRAGRMEPERNLDTIERRTWNGKSVRHGK